MSPAFSVLVAPARPATAAPTVPIATSSAASSSSRAAASQPCAYRRFVGEPVQRSSASFVCQKLRPRFDSPAVPGLSVVSASATGHPSWLSWPWPGDGELDDVQIPLREDGEPLLSHELMWIIIEDKPELPDKFVNALLGYCLGYRYIDGAWSVDSVLECWGGKSADFLAPPDFIGCRPPMVKLTRSTPAEGKQLLKEDMKFEGYKIGELFPRKTRRATAVNWLLAYDKFIRK